MSNLINSHRPSQMHKIVPIRRKIIELDSYNTPVIPKSLSDFTPIKLKLKHYKDSKIIFDVRTLVDDYEIKWIHQSMEIVNRLNKADSTNRYKLQLKGSYKLCIFKKKMIKMRNITEFSLDFSSFNPYGNQELELIKQIIKRQKYIKTISLNLTAMEILNDKRVHEICHVLSESRNNNSLDLNFFWNKNITEKGFNNISCFLKRKNQLQKLRLNLKMCNNFGIAEANQLESSLKSLKNLRSLNLNISGCSAITSKYLKNFKKHFSRMTHLEALVINKKPVDIGRFPSLKKVIIKMKKGGFLFYLLLGLVLQVLMKVLFDMFYPHSC